MIRLLVSLSLIVGASALSAQARTAVAPGAVLRVLDKVSGSTADFELRNGTAARVGRLDIAVSECRYPEGNRSGDAYVGIEIRETGRDEPVFEGWMIASAPALSALDHARYDIWVIGCMTS
ncbi:DUF2155 domain-containing protein [Aliishimia ponticola]|uniref:DUF2155 domain-containing protein n=1 Tax=Aliishimia ponticola TaxID=2499833 RepID=A0A4S4NIM7_9RHOB|nr:DUF2155 domain-containing protein [Aliishimia ponticola]THH38068.1 DUF2155 domain-containing protein [Aliishimia ponticola]